MERRLALLLLTLICGAAVVSAESRRLLAEDNPALAALLNAKDFDKIGKSAPAGLPAPNAQHTDQIV